MSSNKNDDRVRAHPPRALVAAGHEVIASNAVCSAEGSPPGLTVGFRDAAEKSPAARTSSRRPTSVAGQRGCGRTGRDPAPLAGAR